jgi:hypothetical protein
VFALLVLLALGTTLATFRIREELWRSYQAQARASRATDLPGRRYDSLDALAKAARIHPSRELSNEAIAAMALPDLRLDRRFRLDGPPVATVAFDADSDYLGRRQPDTN